VIRPGDMLLHYRFIDSLGGGGEGVVWRALDTRLGREVAIKLLPDRVALTPDALLRLEREARVLAALNHPNIVTVYAVEDAGAHRFVVMELVQGRVLSSLIPEHGMAAEQLFAIALPLADALAAAHGRGVVHRDLKPANVVVTGDGRPKILDFGIAQRNPPASPPRQDAAEAPTATMVPLGLTGTIPYMAPELVRGETADERADVFSFGVLLYEMATGRRPFEGAGAIEILASILRDEPPSPSALRPDLPPEFDRVVLRCLDKDPERRFAGAAALREALDAARQGRAEPLPPLPAAAAGPSVAVMPFTDNSQERDQEWFCDGMADEIIAALARIGGLSVASRTASFRLRGAGLDTREIGRRLAVRALLGGSVRKAGERLRVTAELVDTASGFNLWSETFDRQLEDVFAIQEEIARAIADALEVTLSHGEREALGRPPTTDLQAYECCLRARSYYFQYRRRGVEYAIELFRRALELDPAYARAWAGIALCHCFFYLYVARVPEQIAQAEEAARKALALDPGLAEAQTSFGVAMSTAGREAEAETAFRRALELDPGLFEAQYLYARHLFASGKAEEAARRYELAEVFHPEDYQSPLLSAQILADLGRKREAEAAYRRGLKKVEERLDRQPDDTRARYMGANALVALGSTARGIEWARMAEAEEPNEPMLLYNVGCIYSMAGDSEAALAVLERAVAGGLTQRGWYEHDSNLDPLRGLPRFQALLAGLG